MDLKELLDLPGVEEQCVLRSAVGFMALHGGAQDRGTDTIARLAARRAGASFYAIVQPPTLRVHLTSRLHDPDHSPRLRRFLDHVRIAISVHGFGREGLTLWLDPGRGPVIEPYGPAMRGRQTGPLTGIILGGLNETLLHAARQLLHERFAGFHVADERIRLASIRPTRSTSPAPTASRSSCPRACEASAPTATTSPPSAIPSPTPRVSTSSKRWSNWPP
jgi:hypothetical protein